MALKAYLPLDTEIKNWHLLLITWKPLASNMCLVFYDEQFLSKWVCIRKKVSIDFSIIF